MAKKKRQQPDEGEELSVDDLFDDCAVCQATKAAMLEGRDLGEAELMKAFKQAETKGAVVGTFPSKVDASSSDAARKELKLNLTPDELHALLELVTIGERVVEASLAPNEQIPLHSSVVDAVFKQAYWAGMTDEVERESDDTYHPTESFEDHVDDTWQMDYEDQIFWNELIERLTKRDIETEFGMLEKRSTPLPKELDRLKTIYERYAQEFETHGIDRLQIQSSSSMPTSTSKKKPSRKKK